MYTAELMDLGNCLGIFLLFSLNQIGDAVWKYRMNSDSYILWDHILILNT